MEAAVFVTIVEICLYTLAYHEPIIIIDCYVTCIEDTMNVTSKKNAI